MNAKHVLVFCVSVSVFTIGASQSRLKCFSCKVDGTQAGVECRDSPLEVYVVDCLFGGCTTKYANDEVIGRGCSHGNRESCRNVDGVRECYCSTDRCNHAPGVKGRAVTVTVMSLLVYYLCR
ncbi:hypothetical protein ScPMuIL_008115 [Solemya velum]